MPKGLRGFQKGHPDFNPTGKGRTKRGDKLSDITKKRISEALIGEKNPFYGKNHSEATKEKMRLKKIGVAPPNKGTHYKIKDSSNMGMKRERHWHWKKDRNLLKKDEHRNNPAYCFWRSEVYRRDSWKCRINNCDCRGRIIAHHILSWKNYPELRYDPNNGITLCEYHHPLKRAKEKELIPYFQNILLNNQVKI